MDHCPRCSRDYELPNLHAKFVCKRNPPPIAGCFVHENWYELQHDKEKELKMSYAPNTKFKFRTPTGAEYEVLDECIYNPALANPVKPEPSKATPYQILSQCLIGINTVSHTHIENLIKALHNNKYSIVDTNLFTVVDKRQPLKEEFTVLEAIKICRSTYMENDAFIEGLKKHGYKIVKD